MTDSNKPVRLTVVSGDREALERELLWNIALDGDPARRAQLYRMLTPAANTELAVAPEADPDREQDYRCARRELRPIAARSSFHPRRWAPRRAARSGGLRTTSL